MTTNNQVLCPWCGGQIHGECYSLPGGKEWRATAAHCSDCWGYAPKPPVGQPVAPSKDVAEAASLSHAREMLSRRTPASTPASTPAPERKVVAVDDGVVYCDDGTVCYNDGTEWKEWTKLGPIPGTRAWHEKNGGGK